MNVRPADRAGTPLTRDLSKRINISFHDRIKGETQHGTVDLHNRFYQIGGQFSDFHFRKFDYITMPLAVWEQLKQYADHLNWVEWHDREENAAYLVPYETAAEFGRSYDQGIGPRFGVPMKHFMKRTDRE